jgi:hypothetical protein
MAAEKYEPKKTETHAAPHTTSVHAAGTKPKPDWTEVSLKAATEQQLRQAFNNCLTRLLEESSPEELAAEMDRRGITGYVME